MFLLLYGHHVGANLDGHQHGLSIKSSINLGEILFRTLQLPKKNYRAKLGHDANAESAKEGKEGQRAKKRYELARGRTRARIEAVENVESLWKAVFLLLKSTSVSQLLRHCKREIKTKAMRRSFLLISRP